MRRFWPLVCLAVLLTAASTACTANSPTAPTAQTPPASGPPAATAPVIATQPASQTVASGETATLAVVADGTAPLAYQWYIGDSGAVVAPITGGTSATYTTSVLAATTRYWVRVSNAAGSADSTAATIIVTVPPPPPPPPPPGPDPSVLALEDQVLVLVNQRRVAGATCGGTTYPSVGALGMNGDLRMAARLHSEDMAANNYFSHTSLDGRTFSQRIRNAGYTGSAPLGENIAAGYSTAQSVVDGWMASTGHCANIMSAGYRSIGVGYGFRAGSPYGSYWTQSFGGS